MTKVYDDFFVGGHWVAKTEVLERLEDTGIIDGVMSNPNQRKNRDRAQVTQDCTRGLACEVGIAAMVKGELNPQQFDMTNRETYGWDIKCGITGNKLEVKNHQHVYWSYYAKNIQTLAKNIAENIFDYIVTAKMMDDNDGYVIYPRLVIQPNSFSMHGRERSKFANKLYYNHHFAKARNHCTEYNSEIISVQHALNVL